MEVKPHFTWVEFRRSYRQVAFLSDFATNVVVAYVQWVMQAQVNAQMAQQAQEQG